MTKISKETPNPQLHEYAVKCRFFVQYLFSGGSLYIKNPNGGGTSCSIVLNTIFQINETSYLELKSLSKITDEDAQQLPNREFNGFSKPYESAKEFLNLFELMGFLTSEEADILRKLGYAIPFMEYLVEDLISFGWVRFS